ncbi:MAG: PTS system mannose/fructose/sorbose family transporter subunit IID [Erysipelotrichaceae bacterium]|nr:PTS system mannose/fructose/sorbose family transporter subunit IID [Erysipelotrichaceae bacterium]
MASNVTRNKLTKSDISKMGLYSIIEQAGFSFERMQACGWTESMLPTFQKIYGDSEEDLREFMTYNMQFMNTEMHMATFLMGIVISMEEAGEDRNLIANIKNGLFGPFAGLGDAIFWFTLLPISAAICCSLAQDGSVLGPILYIAIWFVAAISRIWFAQWGYALGAKAVATIKDETKYITKAAGILGVTVIGGLIPSYISFGFSENLTYGIAGDTVQSIFDNVLPNVLPLAFVFFIYYLFKKKNANVIAIIVGIIAVSIALSFLGWM